uniref:DUF674 domain-containing protein n=1 Tax=Leersia perrieri TaxID=77586 RepID=A0A0D9UWW8_9ORYZ
MTGKTPAAASLTMKLLIDTKAHRVLYGEGSKDVIDFLLSLLAVPLGGVTNLLTAGAMVGSLGNLYASVVDADKLGADVKAALLASSTAVLRLNSPADGAASSSTANGDGDVRLYRCDGCACSKRCYNFVTKVNGTPCPVCKRKMTAEVSIVEPEDVSGGVNVVTAPAPEPDEVTLTYTVMDDLTVAPSSTVSAVAGLVALGVTDIRGLQEKTVEVGYDEGLALLKASLQSKTVLTDVFLGARQSAHRRPLLESNNVKASGALTMKLLVDTKAQRVLYAEAGKEVVDFLFSLLTLPVGTVVKVLSKDSMVGSIGKLYGSVEDLDATYVRSADAKNVLLAPAGGFDSGKLLQLPETAAKLGTQVYRCSSSRFSDCYNYVSTVNGLPCQLQCNGKMTSPVEVVLPSATGSAAAGGVAPAPSTAAGTGFVQGVVMYTIMDDLKVAPMSTISGITLLNTFEKTVQMGYTEGLAKLKASLQSNTVLSDVFLGKKRKA